MTDIRNIKLGADKKCPNCGKYNRSGISLPKNCIWCGENKQKNNFDFEIKKPEIDDKLNPDEMWIKGFKAGVAAQKRMKNYSGCSCIFDDDGETILELCLAHKKFFELKIKDLISERLTK